MTAFFSTAALGRSIWLSTKPIHRYINPADWQTSPPTAEYIHLLGKENIARPEHYYYIYCFSIIEFSFAIINIEGYDTGDRINYYEYCRSGPLSRIDLNSSVLLWLSLHIVMKSTRPLGDARRHQTEYGSRFYKIIFEMNFGPLYREAKRGKQR